MSLFDAYDPATYGPSQGGLIDQLLASGALSQIPQSAGFPAAPGQSAAPAPAVPPIVAADDDEGPAAPAQASPIAVGSYQMPRIGPAAAFTPQPTPAPAPQQPQQAAPAPSPLDVIGNHLNAAGRSFSHGGGLIGGTAALITGNRHDPYATAQADQQARVQQFATSLAGMGLPPQRALQLATIHAIDKEAGEKLIAQAFGPPQAAPQYAWDPATKKAVKTYDTEDKVQFKQLKDGLGGDHPAFVNTSDQTINGMPIAEYNKRNASDGGGGLGDTSKTGAAYLATLQPKERGTVQAMLDGRQAPPSSFALGKPYWQNLIAAAQNVDPTFDQTSWPARVKGMTSFRSGADAGTVRSANQVLGHISDLTDKADELHNGDYPSWNYVKNKWDTQTGADAANNWVLQGHAVADELSAFMKGAGHSSDTEIKAWNDSLSPNMSPTQQRGAIKTLMGIYDHALSALEDKRTGAIGSVAAEKMGPLVTPAGQAAMDKVKKWAGGSAPGAGNTTKSGVQWSVEK